MLRVIYLSLSAVYLHISQLRADCQTSISGIALIDHVLISIPVDNIHFCYERCKATMACQSLNFYRESSICELNNRTITTKPLKKVMNRNAVYFERIQPAVIGSKQNAPAESCMEIKAATNNPVSGLYWVKHAHNGNSINTYCNMSTGLADGCVSSPCLNHATCDSMKDGGYKCTCPVGYSGVRCETSTVDKCQPNPCSNGGTCSNVGHDDFSCACVASYIGIKCDVVSSAECSSHTNLTDGTRNVNYLNPVDICDSALPTKWYRFTGAAGVRMASTCVTKNHCNTDAPGWLSDPHPTIQQGILTRKACFHWTTNCCKWFTNIRVRNCSAFYVYELVKSPQCQLRYCGTN